MQRSSRPSAAGCGFFRLPAVATAFLLLPAPLQAQLGQQIAAIAATSHGRVSVACALPGTPLDCAYHAGDALPMQSVYKLPIALAALHAVEQGRLSLATPLPFRAVDCIARDQYSALQQAHPHGGVQVPLEQALRLAVSESDGVASDLVLRALGGPGAVTAYLGSIGLDGIHVVDPEQTLGRAMLAQYRNDASAAALVRLLRRLADGSPLTPEHTALLLNWMTDSQTGEHRLKALLPPGTAIAHKTGTSGTTDRSHNATNDIGLIRLPDGRKLALAVLVADSSRAQPAREQAIARIGRAIYDAAAGAGPYTGRRAN